MKKFLVLTALLLGACAPKIERVVEYREVEITREVPKEVTRVVTKEVTRQVVQTVVVFPSWTPGPTSTPTITSTPTPTTPTPTATRTPDPRGNPRGDGFYLVGVDILPGIWRSTPGYDTCYWARYNSNDDILDNHFGLSGGTIRIRPSDFIVEFDGCGRWEYLGQ